MDSKGGGGKAKEPESNLFKDINQLRRQSVDQVAQDQVDQDAIERAKLNNSIFGRLAGSKPFEYTTLSVIMVNAGFIGYDADFSARFKKPDGLYDCDTFPENSLGASCYSFILLENFFAVYFTMEVVVRFFSYKRKSDLISLDNGSCWFLFDSTLVLFMVVETWLLPVIGASGPLAQLSVLRLLRLLRITRMAKLMRFFPELQIIVKGMLAAVRSVVCTAILLILILYVWAILFTSEFHQGLKADNDDEVMGTAVQLFGSLPKSMRHLFIMGTILDDITLCCNYVRGSFKGPNHGYMMLLMFILFVLISSFTMLNMLIGILCEVVVATGDGQRETNRMTNVREAITNLFHRMDKNSDGKITRDEFLEMRRDKNVMQALKALDVKAAHFEKYAELMFRPEEESGQIPSFDFDKVINMIMRLQPGTTVNALDFASFQQTVYKNHDHLQKHINDIERMACALSGQDRGAQNLQKESSRKDVSLAQMSEQELLAELQYRMETVPSKGTVLPALHDLTTPSLPAQRAPILSVPAPVASTQVDDPIVALSDDQLSVQLANARALASCPTFASGLALLEAEKVRRDAARGSAKPPPEAFQAQLPGQFPDVVWSNELYTC